MDVPYVSVLARPLREWAAMNREEFYATALREAGGNVTLAEYAVERLYDSGFLKRHGKEA